MNAAPETDKPLLYVGVNSVGMGHATRAVTLLEGLRPHYESHVFCRGSVRSLIARRGFRTHEIWQPEFIYADNRLETRRSLARLARQFPAAIRDLIALVAEIRAHRPVAVVSDYEPLTAWAAMLTGTKVVAVDNQHVVTWGQYSDEPDSAASRASRRAVERSTFWVLPHAHRVLISSFYRPPLRPGAEARGVRYVPTAVRAEVLARGDRTRSDGPVLVYQTSPTNTRLLETLGRAHRACGLCFVVYGVATPLASPPSGVAVRAFSEDGFVDDLAAAPFVIVNGGHSTITEALALGKPVLAEPIRDQFEQSTNALGLERLGVGRRTARLCVEDIVSFRRELPALRLAAERHCRVDPDGLTLAVMETLRDFVPARAIAPAALRGARG
ncbi:MAG: glycosyltransferase family protein [Deltaproteobacteria bacterium]